jgi:hypothetical protein
MGGVGGSHGVAPSTDVLPHIVTSSLGQHSEFVEDPMLLESGMVTKQRMRLIELSLIAQGGPTDQMEVKSIKAPWQGYDLAAQEPYEDR